MPTQTLKIGILGTRGIPNRYGGFEECAERLAEGLVQKGHQVTVYNSDRHEYKADTWKGVTIVHCKDPEDRIGTAGQFIYDLNCINDARKRRFDIVLQLGYTSSSVWWWRWPRKAINIVNMDGLEWKRTKYSAKVQAFLKRAERWAALHGDTLISDSLGIQQHLLSTYGKQSAFIPYGANVYKHPDPSVLNTYELESETYHLLIARLEPENNVELVLQGYLNSGDERKLIIVGSTGNAFGKALQEKYGKEKGVNFFGAIYNADVINALRHYSHLYYHGHSVGGTNPSLLEAMGCGALIAAHDNIFNKAILGDHAFYFSSASDVSNIIRSCHSKAEYQSWIEANREKIVTTYDWPKVIDAYEQVMIGEYASRKNKSSKV